MLNHSFYDAKGTIDFLFESLGIDGIWYDDYQQTPEIGSPAMWHIKKSAEVKRGDLEFGFVGMISQGILSNFKITQPVAAFMFDLEPIIQFANEETAYRALPKFPASMRDIAILVPLQTHVDEVLNVIETRGGKLIADVDLFDMYEGRELPDGMKSLAFHITYQSEEKTLKSEEVDELHNAVTKILEENPEWEVRK